MNRTRVRSLAALAALAAVVTAGAAASAQQAPAPRIYLDNGEFGVSVMRAREGYRGSATVPIYGLPRGATEAFVRMEWKQGGRTLATANCQLEYVDERGRQFHRTDRCNTPESPVLTAVGPVQVDFTFVDDGRNVTQPLRTVATRVARFYEGEGMDGNRPRFATLYNLIGDDLLGSSVMSVNMTVPQAGDVSFDFWGATRASDWPSESAGVTSMRCTVNGQPLQGNLGASRSLVVGRGGLEVRTQRFANGGWTEPEGYNWIRYAVTPRLRYRMRADAPRGELDLNDHPGEWACQLRFNQATVREFRFTVAPNGQIQTHAEQQGPNALTLAPQTYLIDTRLPNPNTFDFSVQPDAIRRAGFFGRPWAQPQALQPMFAALPPAMGSSEAPAPSGAGGGGNGGGRGRGRGRR